MFCVHYATNQTVSYTSDIFLLVRSKHVPNVNTQRGSMLKMLRYHLKGTWQEQTWAWVGEGLTMEERQER